MKMAKKQRRIIGAVGARPNFIKIAPIVEELRKHKEVEFVLVHTGQHYDYELSRSFFIDLNIPEPKIHLDVGSGSHAEQTGHIMIRFERVLLEQHPDLVVVVGDVNSTLACALAARKLHTPIAHIEAGLRSFDWRMPEEINRLLTDAISDYLFVTEESGESNLLREGISREKIFFVGNVMIDTLLKQRDRISQSPIISKLRLLPSEYAVLTLHRPENVDVEETFEGILSGLSELRKHIKIVYPIHPRARKRIDEFRLGTRFPFLNGEERFLVMNPISYLHFLKLVSESRFVLTDSGGIQEETTVLEVPCLTLRRNTERPVTVTEGTNTVVDTDPKRILEESMRILDGHEKAGSIPKLWDGGAAGRIVDVLLDCRRQ